MKLKLFKEDFVVCKLNQKFKSPICIDTNNFYYITKFKEELSVVCLNENIPLDITKDDGWKLIEILKPINLYLVEIVSKINKVLEDAKVNIFEISTFDKDYILIKNNDIENACKALMYNGYEIV